MSFRDREHLRHMPLAEIEAEIRRIKAKPWDLRTVADADRLRDLEDAQRRACGRGGF